MEYIGYGFALLIGMVLGLTGGGGAILTVPVLVYIMQLNAVTATAYSLFVVGTTSAFGTLQNYRKGIVDIKAGFWFAMPSLAGVFLARKFLVGAIPDIVFQSDEFTLTKNKTLLIGFALLMLAVGISMLRRKVQPSHDATQNKVLIALRLFVAGLLVGMVGAGGGFLFTPLLLYVARLPMKKAVATSLLIIAINSLLGFTGDLGNTAIDWGFLVMFTAFSVGGIFIGIYLSRFANERQLKKGFGWFVIMVGLFILAKELVF